MIQCFDGSGNLGLLEEVNVARSVRQLCFAPSCGRLAVGAADGTIHVTDSAKLASVSCISKHLHSELIGVGMLSPGNEHCVVRAWNCG